VVVKEECGHTGEATASLQRLKDAEKILYARLANTRVENGNIVWVPPGWGMAWFDRGLRFRRREKLVHFEKLDDEGLHEMMSQFHTFAEHVLEQDINITGQNQGSDIKGRT